MRLIKDTHDPVTFYLHNLHVLSLLPKTKWGLMDQYVLITDFHVKDINLCKTLIAYNSSREGGGWGWGLPCSIYLFKVNNRNTKKIFKICLKLTIKTPERRI